MSEQQSMFGIFNNIKPDISMSEGNRELLRLLKLQQESGLSVYAAKASESRGRAVPENDFDVRSCFERDIGRIIFSQSFRRLRHKTQVFFNPTNDHICSRLEHVIYVNYIACTIGKALNLNLDLIKAIALGHDIGHAPFGHSGERVLNECLKEKNGELFFEHEAHGLRVIDLLEKHNGKSFGLNLSFEVRDGILSHCGEVYDEKVLKPDKDKDLSDVSYLIPKAKRGAPATMEGCVVRFSDKIAYVGRDIEDAVRFGLMESFDDGRENLDEEVVLGYSNAQTINSLVEDIINQSIDRDEIRMSESAAQALENVLNSNVKNIYKARKVKTYEKTVEIMIKGLFDAYYDAASNLEANLNSAVDAIRKFSVFALNHPEKGSAPPELIVTDYIAGMTDQYATDCFNDLYKN